MRGVRVSHALSYAVLWVVLPAASLAGNEVVLTPVAGPDCGANPPVSDHAQIQAAIDTAGNGDVIVLDNAGIPAGFQLCGEPLVITGSNLTLRGEVVDNDGDGQTNEDWDDGPAGPIDNDGDGFFDEDGWDGTLRGTGGLGFDDHGLRITGEDGNDTVQNVTVEDLQFTQFQTAVRAHGGFLRDDASCSTDDPAQRSGTVRNLRVQRNHFLTNNFGVVLQGSLENAKVEDNAFAHENNAVLVRGLVNGCDGAPDLSIGVPRDTAVRDNTVYFHGNGVVLQGDQQSLVSGNAIDAIGNVGIVIEGSDRSKALNNEITNVTLATFLSNFARNTATARILVAVAQDAQITNNVLGGFAGVWMSGQTFPVDPADIVSGHLISNNQHTGFLDIRLVDVAIDNTLIATSIPAPFVCDTVNNFAGFCGGSRDDNNLLGTFKISGNPNVPQEVLDKLEQFMVGRPDPP